MNDVIRQIEKLIDSAPDSMEILNWLFGEQKQNVLFGTPVVLYGTGSLGKEFLLALRNYGVSPVCFCNSDTSKSGTVYCGLPVISMEQLKAQHLNSIILIATQKYAASVRKDLLDNGFPQKQVIWPKDYDLSSGLFFSYINQIQVDINYPRPHLPGQMLDVLHHNGWKILKVYNLLADQKSKDLFIAKLAFMAKDDNLHLFLNLILNFSEPVNEFGRTPYIDAGPENYFYFNNDVFALSPGEVYVDVGAFDGDSVKTFVQACAKQKMDYKHIYAFEPDPQNYAALLKNTKDFKNISCHQLGIWSKQDVLRFDSSNKAIGTSSVIVEKGDIEIHVDSLDRVLNGKDVSLIKIDPPGNVIPASLEGAVNIITRCKPKLIVGAYHVLESTFEIPLIVNSHWPGYKLYLRHNSWAMGETDLYAIPS